MTAALLGADVWVFDLDNTLYPASSRLFDQIGRRIGIYIADYFDIPLDEARVLQRRYFVDYGTTLRGLMVRHAMPPDPYLDFVHQIDVTMLDPAPRLDQALSALVGRKIVFTNGSARHAANVMDRLGIARHFDAVFDIAAAAYVSKPDPQSYAALVRRFGIDPKRAVMVDDIARNLVPAHTLGMTTVWIRGDTATAGDGLGAAIDFSTYELLPWLSALVESRRAGQSITS